MNDLDELQQKALDFSSDQAGAYLESVGQTDLAQLSREQWMQFLQIVVCRYQDKLVELRPCPF